MSEQDRQKQLVGEAAAGHVEDGMTIGLGTGSTVERFAESLGRRIAEGLSVRALPTSEASIDLAHRFDIPLIDWTVTTHLDLCIDGADEVAPDLSMIKGGGGALLWEKIVASAASRRLYIADSSKLVGALGTFPLPVEVVRFGHQATAEKLAAHCPDLARREKGGEPFVTDSGNFIYDCRFGRIDDPAALEAALGAIPGVVECGLFVGMADSLIALRDGVVVTVDGQTDVWWG
ncbi:ribose-5-phosphate isomerase RpiA [Marivibrio halodurans]|uniref:Ribose-5-phosphate isomerase A n=1 Tax=Marivibrio halodurans TaxID=2039722 RepID=A0A8J7SNP8_9PROT|nr:ribose-5-phosphate isomerase RpiA [Marivibrio halodurans]MBP5857811.1 ribose-5-phosphate isomerase RpiA [Marivibrio halodurans]